MVGVKGVGGILEPQPDRPSGVRDKKAKDIVPEKPQDGVEISSKAQEASSVARLVEAAKAEPLFRADKVAAAKERIENGDYKLRQVVEQVAERVNKLL